MGYYVELLQTEQEHDRQYQAARSAGLSWETWARAVLVAEADSYLKSADDPPPTERNS